MTLSQLQPDNQPDAPGHAQGESLASLALARVASRVSRERLHLRERLLDDLVEATLMPDVSAMRRVSKEFRVARVPPEAIVDMYLPRAARSLGEDWCRDALSFTDVTIGCARLQSLLREMSTLQSRLDREQPHSGSVAVIVPEGETHTLGASVLCAQLRRHGIAVTALIGEPVAKQRQTLTEGRFDMVALSISRRERLEFARELIQTLRAATTRATPIVVGGAVLDQNDRVATETGADLVTNDPLEALRRCGLRISAPIAGLGTMTA